MVERPRDPSRPWAPSPFKRLAHTHALSVAGDAMFTTAMAGLVFFSVTNLKQARWQVAAALVFTIVPLSLAAPFIGPLIDRARGGRKWMIVGQCFLRGVVCFLLVWDRDNQLLMYPQFTLVLVLAQGYILARGALVPATVRNDAELVEANSKLAGISGISAIVGALASVTIMWVTSKFGTDRGPDVALFVAGIVYVASSAQAIQLPPIQVADAPPDIVETTELHSPGIRHASVALSVIRVVVGLLTFMLAFHFKNLEETDAWGSRAGLVGSLLAAEVGFLLGAAAAPKLRRVVHEEHIIMLSLAFMGTVGLLTALMTDLAGAVLLAFAVGLTSNTAKQAFDAIVQRDAPDANRGRAFAKFETRFQLWWVLGALVPVIIAVPPRFGFLMIGLGCAGGLLWFWVTLRRALADAARKPSPLAGEPILVEPRPVSRSFIRGRRSTGSSAVASSVVLGAGSIDASGDATQVAASYEHTQVFAPAPPVYATGDPTVVDAPASAPLFGHADAPIPSALVDVPGAGLFAVAADPSVAPPIAPTAPTAAHLQSNAFVHVAPAGAAETVLYDSAAWLDEDDRDTATPPTPLAYRDPGPPSLVPPAAPVGPPAGPPGWPAAPPVRPVPLVSAGSDDHEISLAADDGSYPEPLWRDATPQPLPGFDDESGSA